jgi:hypothetical protein
MIQRTQTRPITRCGRASSSAATPPPRSAKASPAGASPALTKATHMLPPVGLVPRSTNDGDSRPAVVESASSLVAVSSVSPAGEHLRPCLSVEPSHDLSGLEVDDVQSRRVADTDVGQATDSLDVPDALALEEPEALATV